MIAVVGLHNAGVAGLSCLVKAPGIEAVDHLTGVYILVESAVGAAAGVLGVFVCQRSKRFLGRLSRLPAVQQLLRLLFGFCPRFVSVCAVLVLLGGHDENVADIYHGLVDLFHAAFRVGVGVLIIVVADFRVGKLHLVHQLFKIARGAQIVACKRHIVLDRRLGSERRLQICKSAFHAIIVCRRIKALCNRVKLRLIFFTQLEPCRIRLQIQRRNRMEHVCRAG